MRVRWSLVSVLVVLGALAPVWPAPMASAALPSVVAIVAVPGGVPAPVRTVSEDGQWVLGAASSTSTTLANWVTGQSFSVPGSSSSMSSDARYVITLTYQALAPSDTGPSTWDLYRWDRLLDSYTFVTPAPSGYFISDAHISDDGTVVAFTATESIPDGRKNVWTAIVGNPAVQLSTSGGGLTSYPINEMQDLSPNGRFLVYRTSCRFPNCPSNGGGEIRRVDRQTGATVRASLNNSGVESNGGDAVASISPNGRYITFQSAATNLGVGSSVNGAWFVRDLGTNVTRFLTSSQGLQAKAFTDDAGTAVFPTIVVTQFGSRETVYLRDIATGHTADVGVDNHGAPVNGATVLQGVSAAGSYAVIASEAALVAGSPPGTFMAGLRGGVVMRSSDKRLLDTRNAIGVATTTFVPAQQVVTVQVAGRAGVSTGTEAVFVNLAILSPATGGYAKIYACDDDPGEVSSINFAKGQNAANLTMSKLSATGTLCIRATAQAHMLVDFQRIVTDFVPITPVRLIDTRQPADSPSPLLPNVEFQLHVSGANGVDATTQAVAMNVTIVGPASSSYLQAYTCGTLPSFSVANFSAYLTKASLVMAVPDAGGNICFITPATAHLVVDLVGHVPDTATFEPVVTRVLAQNTPSWLGGRVVEVPLGLGGGNSATTAMLGIVAVGPAASGYITAFRCGEKIEAVSVVNFVAGANTNNVAIAPIDGVGRVCLFVSQNVRLVVDLYGTFDT